MRYFMHPFNLLNNIEVSEKRFIRACRNWSLSVAVSGDDEYHKRRAAHGHQKEAERTGYRIIKGDGFTICQQEMPQVAINGQLHVRGLHNENSRAVTPKKKCKKIIRGKIILRDSQGGIPVKGSFTSNAPRMETKGRFYACDLPLPK